ncbi:MAG: Na+/H+ antiporter NhaC family protein [Rubripirellula sp.]|jgi:Na+/H+ antiporter NhaC
MEFGFLSLLPPLVAIVLAVATRRVVLPLAVGVAVGAIVLAFGRVELVTDFGTNETVRVRFVAPSPWVSGKKTQLVLSQRDYGETRLPSVSVPQFFLSPQLFIDNEPWIEYLEITLNSTVGSESTVQDLIDAFENSSPEVRALASVSLEKGEPSTVIGSSLPSELEILDFEPQWTKIPKSGIKFPNSPSTDFLNAGVIFFTTIYESIALGEHVQALIFSLLLGAMVGTLESGGGMRVLIQRVSSKIKSRQGAQTLIATSGLAVFFDDYANTLLLGGTMRSTADRYRLSRQKLAYLVDSTAAPVAGLAVVSTWAAIEISYMADGLAVAGINDKQAAFEMFIRSIPYRFYPWLALVMVYCITISQRDFGPMLKAEQAALALDSDGELEEDENVAEPYPRLWWAAVVPVVLCVVSVMCVLVYTGIEAQSVSEDAAVVGLAGNSLIRQAGQVIGNGDSYVALMVGGAVGLLAAVWMHIALGGCRFTECMRGAFGGARQMGPALLILWFAWALSAMTEKNALDTGGYLSSILSDRLDVHLLPTVVFLIAGAMAFSTGTSWGTMAILTPLSIGLALQLDAAGGPNGAIALATCGSVLAGAIFGDHCSPISDTTVLSSRASGCDHVAHVRTQMPYAMVVGVVCILGGTIPAAFGVSPWISLVLGTVVLIAVVRVFGKLPRETENRIPAAKE